MKYCIGTLSLFFPREAASFCAPMHRTLPSAGIVRLTWTARRQRKYTLIVVIVVVTKAICVVIIYMKKKKKKIFSSLKKQFRKAAVSKQILVFLLHDHHPPIALRLVSRYFVPINSSNVEPAMDFIEIGRGKKFADLSTAATSAEVVVVVVVVEKHVLLGTDCEKKIIRMTLFFWPLTILSLLLL